MKRIISVLLIMIVLVSISACGTSKEEPVEEELSAIEQLSEKENLIFEALKKVTVDSFYEPSAVKVLEVGDWKDAFGPSSVIARLQGENKVGGTVNHYYKICVIAGEDTTSIGQTIISGKEALISVNASYGNEQKCIEDTITLMDYKANVGEFVEIGDDYTITKTDETISAGNINKALAEYWEEMGF